MRTKSISVRYPRRPTGFVGLGMILALTLVAACDSRSGGAEREQANVPAVEAVPARSGALPMEARINGVVKARNQVAIRPEVEGRVIEVLVRSGEAVRQGQPLVRLETSTVREQLRQEQARVRLAEARLAELRAQISRTRSLAEEGLVSPLELETQEAQLAGAEATVDEARATLEEITAVQGRSTMRAPVSGRVGRRDVEVGMLVDSASVLFVVGDLAELIVEVPLTEEILAHVEEDQPVRVSAESLPEPVRARLSRVSPFLAANSFTTTGEIDLGNPDGRLLPGMFVTVDLLYGDSEIATLVPTSATVWQGGSEQRSVFVVNDSSGLEEAAATTELLPEPRRVSEVPVEVLAESRGISGVDGLEPGQWVVTLGQHLLTGRRAGDAESEILARVRPTTWQKVLDLQRLQRQDLLTEFMDKQQLLAEELGPEIPESEDVVDAILARKSTAARERPAGGSQTTDGVGAPNAR